MSTYKGYCIEWQGFRSKTLKKPGCPLGWQPGYPFQGPVAFRPHLTMSLADCFSVYCIYCFVVFVAKNVPLYLRVLGCGKDAVFRSLGIYLKN